MISKKWKYVQRYIDTIELFNYTVGVYWDIFPCGLVGHYHKWLTHCKDYEKFLVDTDKVE